MFAELNGTRVKTVYLLVPYNGIWTADVTLDQAVSNIAQGAAVTLTIGSMALKGTVFRKGDFTGTGSFRIVGGAGGWGRVVQQEAYQASAGVKLSTPIKAAARAVGETIVFSARDTAIGGCFVRTNGPAARVLWALGVNWWVRFDGQTEVGTRATPTIVSQFDTLPSEHGTHLYLGRIAIATDSPQDWQPGAFFSSPVLSRRQVSSVVHRLDSNKLRTEVWAM